MQSFTALMVSVVLATSGPLTRQAIRASVVPDSAEIYVAELDPDWNVAREVRLPCAIELGCTVDLGLAKAGLGRVHVRFDGVTAGKVAVNSVIEDDAGNAVPQPVVMLALDRAGFGAGHYEAGTINKAALDVAGTPPTGAGGQPVILMAIKVPGWVAPTGSLSPSGGDRT